MVKNVLKFSVGGVVIVVLGIGAISGVQYLKYRYSDEYKAKREIDKFIKEYENDPYGGNTPEETLQLFIDALKKGDTDLASKYFVMEKWGETKSYLQEINNKGLIDKMIGNLEKTSVTKNSEEAFFTLTDNNNVVISELVMHTHPKNKRWKITEL